MRAPGSALNRLRYFQRVGNLRYTARKVPAVRFFGFGLDQRRVGGGSRLWQTAAPSSCWVIEIRDFGPSPSPLPAKTVRHCRTGDGGPGPVIGRLAYYFFFDFFVLFWGTVDCRCEMLDSGCGRSIPVRVTFGQSPQGGGTRDRRDPYTPLVPDLCSLSLSRLRRTRFSTPATRFLLHSYVRVDYKAELDGAATPSDQEQIKSIQGWRPQERRNRKRVPEGCPEGSPTRRRTKPG